MKIHHTGDYSEKRKSAYPDIGEQLGALWKSLQHLNDNGIDLPDEALETLGEIDKIKQTFHKPKVK